MKKKIVLVAAILLLTWVSARAEEAPSYTNDSVARLNHITGNTYLQRASDLGYEEGQVNMPVTEGDRLGTTDGRAEVALGRGNFLRLDLNTKVDFLNLPKKGFDRTRIKAWAGSIYLSIPSLLKEKGFEIHTPDVSVYVLEKGLIRLDVLENEKTEILVFEGAVEMAGEGGSNILGSGQMIGVAGGRFLSRPARFTAALNDTFDEWNADRDALLGRQLAEHQLPEELWEYEYELDQYGDWRYMDPYGTVWFPRGLGPDWRPYYHGRWVWIPFCGWTWTAYDPWGWAPFHYGRWHWDPVYGWYWIPSTYWGPGWVSWWWGWDYYGWAPLGWYDRPIVIINNRFYSRYDNRYPPHSRSLVVIHKNQLKAPDVSKVALSADKLRNVENIVLTTDRKLAPRPESYKGVSLEKMDNGRLMLRNKESSGLEERVIRSRSRTASESDSGAIIRERESGRERPAGQTGSEARGQESGRSTRQVKERSSQDSGSKSTEAEKGASTGKTSERKIRKKDDGDNSAAASGGYLRSNSIPGYPSSSESGQRGYTSRFSTLRSNPSTVRGYDSYLRSGSTYRPRSSASPRISSSPRSSSGLRSSGPSSRSSSRAGSSSSGRSSSGSARRKK